MAIKYLDVKSSLEDAPLSIEELKIISRVEEYIDSEIKSKFNNDSLYFDVEVFEFCFDPNNQTHRRFEAFDKIKSTRKKIMTEELVQRYKNAGWIVKREQGEDDGPNRPAIPYYTLRGK